MPVNVSYPQTVLPANGQTRERSYPWTVLPTNSPTRKRSYPVPLSATFGHFVRKKVRLFRTFFASPDVSFHDKSVPPSEWTDLLTNDFWQFGGFNKNLQKGLSRDLHYKTFYGRNCCLIVITCIIFVGKTRSPSLQWRTIKGPVL